MEDLCDVGVAKLLTEKSSALPSVVGEDATDGVIECDVTIIHFAARQFNYLCSICETRDTDRVKQGHED